MRMFTHIASSFWNENFYGFVQIPDFKGLQFCQVTFWHLWVLAKKWIVIVMLQQQKTLNFAIVSLCYTKFKKKSQKSSFKRQLLSELSQNRLLNLW